MRRLDGRGCGKGGEGGGDALILATGGASDFLIRCQFLEQLFQLDSFIQSVAIDFLNRWRHQFTLTL